MKLRAHVGIGQKWALLPLYTPTYAPGQGLREGNQVRFMNLYAQGIKNDYILAKNSHHWLHKGQNIFGFKNNEDF